MKNLFYSDFIAYLKALDLYIMGVVYFLHETHQLLELVNFADILVGQWHFLKSNILKEVNEQVMDIKKVISSST